MSILDRVRLAPISVRVVPTAFETADGAKYTIEVFHCLESDALDAESAFRDGVLTNDREVVDPSSGAAGD